MTTATRVNTASQAIGARRVATRADTATTTATSALMSSTRVVSRVQVNDTSWSNSPALVSGVPARAAKVSTTSSRAASAQMVAAVAAYRVAVTRRWVRLRSGARKAASPSSPTVAADASVLTLDTSGTPQRTSGPGSASASGATAPVIQAATTAPTSPASTASPRRARQPRRASTDGFSGVAMPPA